MRVPAKKSVAAFLCALVCAVPAQASGDLLFLEVQGIFGYSTGTDSEVWHSAGEHEPMQKNSVGFDYVRKFSGSRGDWATAALQFRLAYDDSDDNPEAQLYNAYFKAKTALGDFWLGHNRVAFGLASYWDTHADLLGDLTMRGVSFDRDWGIGYAYDTAFGNVAASLTTGTGMGIRTYGNWLAGARAAYGVLNYDNYTTGISLQFGRVLDVMGYEVMNRDPAEIWLFAWDGAWNFDNFEQKIELDVGQRAHAPLYALLYRFGVIPDADERWKAELQASFVRENHDDAWLAGACISRRVTSDLTLRFMISHNFETDENLFVGQFYYYLPV